SLVAFDQNQIAGRQLGGNLMQRRLFFAQALMHDGVALRRDYCGFRRSGFSMSPGIGSLMIDVEIVMGVLDRRDAVSTGGQACNQTLGHRRLAGIFPAGNTEKLLVHFIDPASFRAATRSSGRLMLKNGSYVSGLSPAKASGKSAVSKPMCLANERTLALFVPASQADR